MGLPKIPFPAWLFLLAIALLLGGVFHFNIYQIFKWAVIVALDGAILAAAALIIGLIISPFVPWPKKVKGTIRKGGRRR